jgi:signal transduction histidine kinase
MRNSFKSNEIGEVEDSCLIGLSGMLDHLPVGLFFSTPEGELGYFNRFLSDLLKADEKEASLKLNSLRDQISEQAKHCATTENPHSTMLFHPQTPNLSARIFPTKDEGGRVMGIVGLVDKHPNAEQSKSNLEKKINELSILCELGKVLRSTLDLEEILGVVLTAVTAGQGLGFNRAFLLLVDDTQNMLEGKMAVGPSNPEEAQRIWESLSTRKQSLEEVLRSRKSALRDKDKAVNLIARKLKILLSENGNPLVKSMLDRRAFVMTRGQVKPDHGLFDMLQTDSFATAPLISEDKTWGVVIADNLITRKPIQENDVKLLSICAHHASIAIEKSRLYQELEEKVKRLAEANKRIAEGSKRLLKVERLSILGQITSQLAHELRNPMTIIGGFAQSVLRKMHQDDPDAEYLKIIVKETERMESVLDNVLDFSKPDSANLEMVSLNELVIQTLEMMAPENDSGKVSISTFLGDQLPSVRVNPDLIRQVLLNVFRNSVRAMPNGGLLSVTTKANERHVRIEIKDTGFGISSDHIGQIFDAFFTTDSEACGLGLTIASEIIKSHGGEIGVDSAQGKGSTFFIELPLTIQESGTDFQSSAKQKS